jgi:RAD50-interacting protein 1
MRNTFSTSGALQFFHDVTALWDLMDMWLGNGQGEAGMRKLHEGVSLLSLSLEGADEQAEKGMGLRNVEKRLFENNVKAKEVLEELGLGLLTESEARAVLERRVELGS